ncbi:PHP domain-containing protein, partial [Klebsiella pneumoniae]|uniref:PHP domain-containing protein n=1 Tax=Klebsiella pneumoniae TaxID=573 RepID=UPI001D0CEDFD
MPGRFVHLHTHSHYSFLQALPKVPELVKEAKKQEMFALGLTDAGNMHGAVEFYQKATKAGIKPIIGVDAYLAPHSRHDKDRTDQKRTRLVLLAENNQGYKNLMALITKSFLEGFLERPRMDKELL